MSFDWIDYVKLAESLINQDNEADLRSGISRAYYGAFCIARDLTKSKYKNCKGQGVHQKVSQYYKSSGNAVERFIGITLDQLRKNRNDADYDGDKTIDSKSSKRALLKSKGILKNLGCDYEYN